MENKLLFSFSVTGQIISRQDNLIPVGKCRNVYRARFKFQGDIWEGEKTALFRMGDTTKAAVLDANDECDVPWEFFDTEGTAYGKVSVFCGDLVTANETSVLIMQSGYTKSDASVPPTPDVYQQIMDIVGDTKKIAQSVRDDANAGKFNGIDGDSAYEIAVQFGFAGTEEEWLESLRYDHSDEFLAMAENVRKAIESEGAIQAKKVTDAGSEQIKLVNTTGSEQTSAISAEGKKQLEAVNKATAEIVADREQINQNKKDIEQLDCSKSDAIVDSESGEVITLSDSDDESFLELTIFGRSVQDGVPSQTNPVSIQSVGDKGNIKVEICGKNLIPFPYLDGNKLTRSGITYTVLQEGSVHCVGKATEPSYFRLASKNFGNSIEEVNENFKLKDCFYNINNKLTSINFYPEEGEINTVKFPILLMSNIENQDYEPYKEPQSLVLQTPNGLSGIKVESGGNYTDSLGQQWICDEIDLERGKYVQRIWKKTFNGSEDFYPYSYVEYAGFAVDGLPESMNRRIGFSNIMLVETKASREENIWLGVKNNSIYCKNNRFYDNSFEDKGLANWKAFLAQNPMEIVTYITTPIEHDLPSEVIEQYSHIHTYYPTTIISNDENAGMEVSYVADTKNYIEKAQQPLKKQIAELQNALISQKISGGGIKVTDSSGLPVEEFTMSGKTEQIHTTGKNLFDAESWYNFYHNAKQDIFKEVVDGRKCLKWRGSSGYDNNKKEDIKFPFYVKAGTTFTISFYGKKHKKTGHEDSGIFVETTAGGIGDIKCEDVEVFKLHKRTYTIKNDVVSLGVYYNYNDYCYFSDIQIELGEQQTEYEPYTGGKPSPSTDFPQPVENTTRGIITVDFTDGTNHQIVKLNCPREFTKWDKLEKINGVWKWAFCAKKTMLQDIASVWEEYKTDGVNQYYFVYTESMYEKSIKNIYADRFRADIIGNRLNNYNSVYLGKDAICFNVNEADYPTLESWKMFVEKTPVELLFKTKDVEYIPLSQFEQDKLNALTMYAPNTEITNTGGCNMELTYTVDTKTYIDTKIAEVSTAIVQKGI